MTGTWVGGPRLRLCSCHDPQMPQQRSWRGPKWPLGAPGPPQRTDWLECYLSSGGLSGNWKKGGAILVSLPPVAVVTALAARDIRGSVRVVVVGG